MAYQSFHSTSIVEVSIPPDPPPLVDAYKENEEDAGDEVDQEDCGGVRENMVFRTHLGFGTPAALTNFCPSSRYKENYISLISIFKIRC